MVLRVAIMDGDTVANLAIWDGEAPWTVDGARIVPDDTPVELGWRWSDEGWVEPEVTQDHEQLANVQAAWPNT